MKAIINPSILSGTISAPPSKSVMQRACAAALIRKGKSIIFNAGNSNDDLAAISIIQALGANISIDNQILTINSNGIQPVLNSINCGESGLSVRMFTPIAALSSEVISVNGIGSLLNRPMNFFDEVLPQLSVFIQSNEGKLPFTIKGPLQPRDIKINGSLSSQFLTGLLMAFAASKITGPVTISVTNLKSKPYIDLTLDIMKSFHLNVPENYNYENFTFHPYSKNDDDTTIEYTVEGDWSGASFLLVAAAIAGNITITGLDIHSSQADKNILYALKNAQAIVSVENGRINVSKSNLKAFDFDATDCPDLFPPLVALAAYCEGITTISGVHRLIHKESNRAVTLQQEFGKMGIDIQLQEDVMMIHGGKVVGSVVQSHHDHRIAMACSVAALNATGATVIEDAHAIDKSYPEFYNHLIRMGASITI